ncbi:MAG: MarR family transcriptional regulator [Syntrophaceae bacterium]
MSNKKPVIAEIIDNLRRVFHVVHEKSKKAKRETGLTGPQLWAIKVIAEESSITISDLARRMYLHPATVVGIVNRLESLELVKRNRISNDRRIVHVALTPEGSKIPKQSPEVAQGLLVSGLEPLSLKRLKEILGGLEELVRILRAQEMPPQLILSPEKNIPGKDDGNS